MKIIQGICLTQLPSDLQGSKRIRTLQKGLTISGKLLINWLRLPKRGRVPHVPTEATCLTFVEKPMFPMEPIQKESPSPIKRLSRDELWRCGADVYHSRRALCCLAQFLPWRHMAVRQTKKTTKIAPGQMQPNTKTCITPPATFLIATPI